MDIYFRIRQNQETVFISVLMLALRLTILPGMCYYYSYYCIFLLINVTLLTLYVYINRKFKI